MLFSYILWFPLSWLVAAMCCPMKACYSHKHQKQKIQISYIRKKIKIRAVSTSHNLPGWKEEEIMGNSKNFMLFPASLQKEEEEGTICGHWWPRRAWRVPWLWPEATVALCRACPPQPWKSHAALRGDSAWHNRSGVRLGLSKPIKYSLEMQLEKQTCKFVA